MHVFTPVSNDTEITLTPFLFLGGKRRTVVIGKMHDIHTMPCQAFTPHQPHGRSVLSNKIDLRSKSDFYTFTFSFFPDEPEARSLTPKLSRSELIEILDSLANEIPETHRKRLRYGLF